MFHTKKIKEVLKELCSSEKGLSSEEARQRLEKYGLNIITEEKKISPFKIFLNQFAGFIVLILIGALVVSIILGEIVDAVVIGIILILNAVLGFIQEYRAEKSIEALKRLASLKATVLRDNKAQKVDSSELVPGDIVLIETGEKVPADSRLIEIVNLETQEASLTGESTPVGKQLDALPEKTIFADRTNMIFSGTIITNGRGKAVVTGTGMGTEIGKIAKLIQEEEDKLTPLQLKLKTLGQVLGILTIIICIFVTIGGFLKGNNLLEMFIVGVSLAVAAIPEGLPAVVTISLALGVQRMIKKNALIRKLPSVETLGSTTIICTDKTGTLTCNEMTVKKIYTNEKIIDVSGSGYETKGDFLINSRKIDAKEIELLLKIGLLNNNADIHEKNVIGDPTEAALIVSALKAGLKKQELEEEHERTDEICFTSERKIMSTVHKYGKEKLIFTKGAPEVIARLCDRILINSKIRKITDKDKKKILDMNRQFASDALRVLGFAYKQLDRNHKGKAGKNDEKNLVFVGLQGMIDPARKEVKEAIAKCKKAGIRVIMITGDYEITAKAIAKEIGIEGKSINGAELENIKNFESIVEEIGIYARVNPEHKLKIVDALKKKGHIVAMTGDGVNDAPALKKADIGIAMGITGTDVAKEASHMILTDDNFASIVNAVEEGRGIYDNIKKFVNYLLSSNMGEVLIIFLALLVGLPLPLIAIQILWVNLVTDGFPALALGVDPAEKDIMERPPRKPNEKIISVYSGIKLFLMGFVIMVGTLLLFNYYNANKNLIYAQTVAFSTLVMFEMFNVINCKSERNSIFNNGLFNNKKLILAILSSIALQLAVIYTPLSKYFKVVPLQWIDWVYIIAVSFSIVVFIEIYKFITNKINSKNTA